MSNGWTGGQYSIVRACAGAALAVRFVAHALDTDAVEAVLHFSGALWSIPFALGWAERSVAYALAPTLIAAGFANGELGPGQVHWLALAVLLHLATPPAPYLSLDARGRVDPGGGWRMPDGVVLTARLCVVGVLATLVWSRSQPYLALAWYAALACDPRWIPALRAKAPTRVFYDGDCGLCHRLVRCLLAEQRGEDDFRFAPLQGESFARLVDAEARARLPDSVVVATDDGRMLVRSQASCYVLARLGGMWRVFAALLAVVPRPVRDVGYDFVARVRKRVFAPPQGACPLVPPHLAQRLDP